MFFHKLILPTHHSETASLSNNQETESHTLCKKEKPIYIVGDSEIAYFLGAKLSAANHYVIMLTDSKTETALSTNGIIIKEDYQLQKLHYKPETATLLRKKPQLVIIASYTSNLKSFLTNISPSKVKSCPIISFTQTRDKKFLSDILHTPIIQAYFNGWLNGEEQVIDVYGKTPEISLCCQPSSSTDKLLNLFSSANLPTQLTPNETERFWNYFSIYAPCSILTASTNKSIFEITKDKNLREKLQILLSEIIQLAPQDTLSLNADDTLKKIFSIPSRYIFPFKNLVAKRMIGDFSLISSFIEEQARQQQCELPYTRQLLKSLYEGLIESEPKRK